MDAKPFLVLDLNEIDETLIPELRKLSKEVFDLDSVINAAGELKYIGEIKRTMAQQFKDPEDEWVRFFTTRVYDGAFTQRVREQFSGLVSKASTQFLNEQVNGRLKTALGAPNFPQGGDDAELASNVTSEAAVEEDLAREPGIETTLEEIEGFQIVRAIVCSEIKLSRVVHRDSKSYLAIIADDNNRKPIARLHFNHKQKYIGLFDEEKNETRVPIVSLDEIYEHADALRDTARRYV